MASQAESIDIRCPSCQEPVQSKWKCCPCCETRLECPLRQATTHINLPDCLDTDSKTDADIGSDDLETTVVGSDDLETTVEEYLRVFEEAVHKDGVANLVDYINHDLNKWTDIQINIAVIGESGTGKSEFINTIRGSRPGDILYANTGSVEKTKEIQKYPHPENQNLVFWDLPGVGTPTFPKDSYLRAIDVKKYDFFILVSATRFKENDAWLVNEINHLEKKFYFVKSKIDFDVANDCRKSGVRLTQVEISNTLRENAITELMRMGIKFPKVFLVNNRNIHEYDFKDLITQLINDTPDLKRDTLVRSMASLARTILDEKRKMLQKRELIVAILASTPFQGSMPGTSVNKSILFCEVKLYKQQFGTDENALKIIADKRKTTIDDLVQKLDIRSTSIVRSVDVFNSFWGTLIREIGTGFATSIAAIALSLHFQRRMRDMCYNEAFRIISAQQNIVIGKNVTRGEKWREIITVFLY